MPTAPRLLVLLFLLVGPLACFFEPDPEAALFRCAADAECGEGYRCVPQLDEPAGRSLCWAESAIAAEGCNGLDDDRDGLIDDEPVDAGDSCTSELLGECAAGVLVCEAGELRCQGGEPAPEGCNDLDDDCDGQVDDGFDLQLDPANCGACGEVCGAGSDCAAALCRELDCTDAVDNDGDGLTDVEDTDCP